MDKRINNLGMYDRHITIQKKASFPFRIGKKDKDFKKVGANPALRARVKSRAPIAVANYYTACKASTVKAGSIATAREGLGLDSAGFACYAVPNKTHKNMAYYYESYAEMIMLIKKFQKEYFLPLEVIKNAIDELGHDKVPNMANELVEKLVQAKQLDWMEPASVDKQFKYFLVRILNGSVNIHDANDLAFKGIEFLYRLSHYS